MTSPAEAHSPVKLYLVIYVALLTLLGATVAVAFINLGTWNIVVALIIATIKALLVILFFMHVKDSEHLIWVFAAVGFLWMTFMYAGIFGDYLTRS